MFQNIQLYTGHTVESPLPALSPSRPVPHPTEDHCYWFLGEVLYRL